MKHARSSSSAVAAATHLVNANKTPYLRRTEARKGRENSSAKRDSLFRPGGRVLRPTASRPTL